VAQTDRMIRCSEVESLCGIARSTIYTWIARGEFPPPVRLGTRNVAWRESDVAEWLQRRSDWRIHDGASRKAQRLTGDSAKNPTI